MEGRSAGGVELRGERDGLECLKDVVRLADNHRGIFYDCVCSYHWTCLV